jgi:hypothetical protein
MVIPPNTILLKFTNIFEIFEKTVFRRKILFWIEIGLRDTLRKLRV